MTVLDHASLFEQASLALVDKQTLGMTVPSHLVRDKLIPELKANEGEIYSTDFNRVRIENLDLQIQEGAVRLTGSFSASHRELLMVNPLTGKRHYIPWVQVSGNIGVTFSMGITENKIVIEPHHPDIQLNGHLARLLVDIVESFSRTTLSDSARSSLVDLLSDHNNKDLTELLRGRYFAQIYSLVPKRDGLQISEQNLRDMLNSNYVMFNLNVNTHSLELTARLSPETGISFGNN